MSDNPSEAYKSIKQIIIIILKIVFIPPHHYCWDVCRGKANRLVAAGIHLRGGIHFHFLGLLAHVSVFTNAELIEKIRQK